MDHVLHTLSVRNGQLANITPVTVMVSAEADLDAIVNEVPAGSIAYTAGFAQTWMKSQEGSWVEITGEG